MHGSGAVSCSCSLLIRGPNLPAVRQKLHLSPCADSRSRLSLSGLEILHGRLMNAVKRRNSKNYNFKFTELNDGWFDVRYAAPHWYDGRDPQLMNAVKRRNSKNYNFKFTELNDGWFDVRYAAPLFA